MFVEGYQSGLMSVEDYLALERTSIEIRYEFIDGQVYMLAGGTINHSIISANIIRELGTLLRGKPCRVHTSDMKVQVSKKRYLYPDVSVSCDNREQGTAETLRNPCLIVEVLSRSTEARDRGEKFACYRECPTVQEYVMVNTQQPAVEVFRRVSGNFWTLHIFGPGDMVDLVSLNVSFPVTAVYENTDLLEETLDS